MVYDHLTRTYYIFTIFILHDLLLLRFFRGRLNAIALLSYVKKCVRNGLWAADEIKEIFFL